MLKRFTQPPHWTWGTMINADGATLRHGQLARHDEPVANIVLGPGRSEFSEKYFELARQLGALRYNIYTLNWRGQGGSAPYLRDRFRHHSLGVERDVRDLLQFTNHHVPGNAPKILLAHSMGGLIGLLALRQAPGVFSRAVLSAPLLGFQSALGRGREWLLAQIPTFPCLMERYMPGGRGWVKRCDATSADPSHSYSSDPRRMCLHDDWMEKEESLRLGSPTIGFIRATSQAIISLRRPGALESITTPVLVFSAGDDRIVSTSHIFDAAARLPQGRHIHLPAARHEILMESKAIRHDVLKQAHRFIMTSDCR